MPTIEESIYIPKPPQEVFDYVIAPSSPPEWDTAIVEYRQDDAIPHVGSRSTGTTKVLGRRIEWTAEVIEFDPPHRVGIAFSSEPASVYDRLVHEAPGNRHTVHRPAGDRNRTWRNLWQGCRSACGRGVRPQHPGQHGNPRRNPDRTRQVTPSGCISDGATGPKTWDGRSWKREAMKTSVKQPGPGPG